MDKNEALALARRFHETYERLSLDPGAKKGDLVAAVCSEILADGSWTASDLASVGDEVVGKLHGYLGAGAVRVALAELERASKP